jgi:hypothetical protein
LSLIIRPPRTIPSAVWRLIIGLTLMFTLAPATRYGYFIYPLALLMWLEISQLGQRRATAEARAAPDAAKPMASSASPA